LEQRPLFLVRDRDAKFTFHLDGVFRSESVRLIRAPVAARKAKPHASVGWEAYGGNASTGC
jgi:hypothetical protein